MQDRSRYSLRLMGPVVLGCLLLFAWTYRATLLSIGNKWLTDTAFSHGFLILPIVLWLVWRKRGELAAASLAPSWLGSVMVAACAATWIVAHGSGVLVVEQFSVVAMAASLVLAVMGLQAVRLLMFPLAFVFLAVPFGHGMVPWLMQLTADIATLGLRWTGVPVLRSHMHISIPAGSFEVARACSGLNYFIAGLVLGVLYAHLTYRGWAKRALCVAAFIVIPIFLNGVRVYVTILVSHLTDMRFGPGHEHVTFGRIFFLAVVLLMFIVGRRWRDEVPGVASRSAASASPAHGSAGGWMPLLLALGAMLLGPPFLASSVANAHARLADTAALIAMPVAAAGWRGPEDGTTGWRPLYRDGLVERQAVYVDPEGGSVDVFVAVYGLGATGGAEMISYGNVIDTSEHRSLAQEERVHLTLADGADFSVREFVIDDRGVSRLVWHWFVVGDRPVAGRFAAKALEAASFITRSADSERIVTLSTPFDARARDVLRAFLAAHEQCVTAGFPHGACAG